ncbi:HAD family hydrolase [Glycomyces arizonensis]|uniref:HAD family hydrolase n=1 Tax=Glycomyces arizonensis TaxID=256035 RepID=UPI000412E8BE|nr:HAD family hydrolase [Glycomyces arizonensis]
MTRTSTQRVDRRTPVLLTDAGGVLLLNNHSLLLPLVSRYGGVTTPEAYQRASFACHSAANPADGGTGDYYGLFGEFAGIPEERREAFTDEFRALSHTRNMCHLANPHAVAMLRRVAAKGIPVVVVSQADGTAAQLLREAEVCQVGDGPGVTVAAVVDSAIVGIDKPDPELFRHALDLVGAAPSQAVHLGDTVPADVRGAQAAGIRALHYDPFGDCGDVAGDHPHVRRIAETETVLDAMAAEL